MSRQQRRARERKVDKKVGQLIGLRAENFTVRNEKKAKANLKNMIRLEGELMELGVIKRPGKFRTFFGRLRMTLKGLKRRWR